MISLENKSALDCEQEIRFLIDEGQFFYAYDLSVKALEKHPDNTLLILLGALALINSGAVTKACSLLDPVQEQLETSDIKAQKLYSLFHQCIQQSLQNKPNSDPNNDIELKSHELQLFKQLATTIQTFSVDKSKNKDIKTLKVAAEVFYKIWEKNQQLDDLKLSKKLSLECFILDHSVFDGIRAAILSWISFDKKSAVSLAQQIQQQCIEEKPQVSKQDLCQYYLTLALTQLLLNDQSQAILSCKQAMLNLQGKHVQIVNMRKILTLMAAHKLNYPDELLDILKPPVIVIFSGQPIDHPNSEEDFFPENIEHHVAHAISNKLDKINAEIGYCCATCGSDLLFIEAMLDRGAEVNIILPFAQEDFLNARIRYASQKWERRFKNALKLVSKVNWSTKDPYLNDDELFRYNNLLIEGGARLRAESLQTIPQLMVVMDYLAPDFPGSAADFMDQWADISSLHMIDLDNIREKAVGETENDQSTINIKTAVDNFVNDNVGSIYKTNIIESKPRVIKSMLFADIVHYSKMSEEQLPAIFEFLAEINEKITLQTAAIDLIESWGDALYVAMSSARDMADYAFALCQALEDADHTAYGLSIKPELRIGLHVGPVYQGIHPLTGRKIIFGQHVSRAARIEPITVPGEIYTSEHFVAVLKAEENVARHVAHATQAAFEIKYYPEYIGILELPKKFGNQAVYHLCLV